MQITQEAEEAGRAFAVENAGDLSQQPWSLIAAFSFYNLHHTNIIHMGSSQRKS